MEVPIPALDEASTAFNPANSATVQGRVVWDGTLPAVPPYRVPPNPLAGEVLRKSQIRPNPNAPAIDPQDKGVGNAVVFLRGIDPKQARPWDYPPVKVEMQDCQFRVRQGDTDSHFGFVQCGAAVEMVSRDAWFHSLHADGSSFFSFAFPDPDQPLERPLRKKGIVELTGAPGYYWMRAYLFVDDQPYYARTDSQGRFQLSQVPPGRYEIVCWMADWHKARHERDPESGLISRLYFHQPVERTRALTLGPGETKQAEFVLSPDMFAPGPAQ